MMLDKNPELVWIVWEVTGRRTQELSRYFGMKFFELKSELPRKLKLFSLIIQTLWIILNIKPRILVVASIRLAALLVFLKPVFRYILVVDCHYSGIVPGDKVPECFHFLYKMVHRKADLVIVTNKPHAEYIHKVGGIAFVLQDRIPTPSFHPVTLDKCNHKKVVCISSYNTDEQTEEILLAAQKLTNNNIKLFLTGDSRDKFAKKILPVNVILTGYLPDEDYWKLLWEADVIIDLTTRENCLVCGAYEAIAVEKPIILSDTSTLRNYFVKGALFCNNNGTNIAQAILYAIHHSQELKLGLREFKQDIRPKWEFVANNLLVYMYNNGFENCYSYLANTQKNKIL